MNIIDIILKKKAKKTLTKKELEFVIKGYVNDEIKDYQMSSLLMAININGMTDKEVLDLTDIMLHSGEVIDLSSIDGIVVDKHSTGGVGDKTSLIVLPIVACSGVKIAKMSGRGLGHTGGTIDKLESIPGFKVNLSNDDFIKQVNDIGLAIVAGNENLVIADKKIYALRDVTGNVESIPLIASSIMSKKIASGASKIVIDLKLGNGALIKNKKDAKTLANLMIKIGKFYDKEVVVFITNMDEPLGYNIGNSLEVLECIDILKNNKDGNLKDLCLNLAGMMISLGKNISFDEGLKEANEILESKRAYQKFEEWISYQNGDLTKLKVASKMFSLKSNKDGYITKIDTYKLGNLARSIKAGRYKKEDSIDYEVGFVLNKKIGDFVFEGEELVKIYINDKDLNVKDVIDCFKIEDNLVKPKLIIDIIRDNGCN